jgi:hypothetical protein
MLRRSLIGGAQVRIPVVRFSTLFERFLGRYEFPGHARDAGQKRRSRSEAGFDTELCPRGWAFVDHRRRSGARWHSGSSELIRDLAVCTVAPVVGPAVVVIAGVGQCHRATMTLS